MVKASIGYLRVEDQSPSPPFSSASPAVRIISGDVRMLASSSRPRRDSSVTADHGPPLLPFSFSFSPLAFSSSYTPSSPTPPSPHFPPLYHPLLFVFVRLPLPYPGPNFSHTFRLAGSHPWNDPLPSARATHTQAFATYRNSLQTSLTDRV
eukprot:762614-Hanusia_phi.AAC.2